MPPRRLEALRRIPHDVLWLGLITLSLLLAEAVAASVALVYGYDRWDNFEYYTPMIAAAHRALASGEFPLWNPHQHLGESFLTNPQMGTFYPPYTLAYLVVTGLHLKVGWLCGIISVSHAIVGAWGCFTLLGQLGVRRSLACVAALGMASGGYLRSVSAVWVFVGPTFAWLPWTLWGAVRLLDGSRRVRDGAAFVVGLTAQAYIGHPQIWVYVWLCVGMCCVAHAFASEAPWRDILRSGTRLAGHAVAAAALGALTMLPVLMQSRNTARKAPVGFRDFVHSSASIESLWGLLLPFYRTTHDFITEEACSFMLHQGAWLLPALGLGGVAWIAAELGGTADRHLARRAVAFILVGGVLLVFALGKNTPIFGLTYAIPVWSSFRWPHKFLIVALPCLGLGGALMLELVARTALTWRWRIAAVFVCVAVGAVAARHGWADILGQPLGRWGLFAAGLALFAAPFANLRPVRGVLVGSSVASAAVVIALAQSFTPNAFDEPETLDKQAYGWSREYRILPVQRVRSRAHTVERMLFTTATLFGLDSVTGCTTAMAPEWYVSWLKSDALGLLPDATYQQLLPSHFLRSLNVKYVVAPARDRTVEAWLNKGGLVLERRLPHAAHYTVPNALPRVYFASELHEFTADAFWEGLWLNGADIRAGYVEGSSGGEHAGTGKVLRADFARPARPILEVDSAAGGFVIVSVSFTPEWRAFVDGAESKLLRTNAMLQGLQVPPGRHRIELVYDNPAFRWGMRCAAFGVLVLLIIWVPSAGWSARKRARVILSSVRRRNWWVGPTSERP
jgi:hypothetical protein